jgi:hypothetical protein
MGHTPIALLLASTAAYANQRRRHLGRRRELPRHRGDCENAIRYLNDIEGNKLSIWMAARGIRYVHATAMAMKG